MNDKVNIIRYIVLLFFVPEATAFRYAIVSDKAYGYNFFNSYNFSKFSKFPAIKAFGYNFFNFYNFSKFFKDS